MFWKAFLKIFCNEKSTVIKNQTLFSPQGENDLEENETIEVRKNSLLGKILAQQRAQLSVSVGDLEI